MIEIQSVGINFGLATKESSLYITSSGNMDIRNSIRSAVQESLDFWACPFSERHPIVMPDQLMTPWQIVSLKAPGYSIIQTDSTNIVPFVIPLSAIESDEALLKWHHDYTSGEQSLAGMPNSFVYDSTNGRILYKGLSALNSDDGYFGEGLYCIVIPGVALEESQESINPNGNRSYIVSEPFTFSRNVDDFTTFYFKNTKTDLSISGSVHIDFSDNFFFKVLLPSALGRPEYVFEETISERMGYKFYEAQTSKKTYKISFPATESMCDTLRISKLCNVRQMKCGSRYYNIIAMDMSVEWLEQGDIASVTLTIDVDSIVNTAGEYAAIAEVGDFDAADYNNDYDDVTSEDTTTVEAFDYSELVSCTGPVSEIGTVSTIEIPDESNTSDTFKARILSWNRKLDAYVRLRVYYVDSNGTEQYKTLCSLSALSSFPEAPLDEGNVKQIFEVSKSELPNFAKFTYFWVELRNFETVSDTYLTKIQVRITNSSSNIL